MPNWCENNLTMTHKDPAMIKRAADALGRGEFLEEFIPVPQHLKESDTQPTMETVSGLDSNYTSWYDFCVNEWGTKWDVECTNVGISEDGQSLGAFFTSAWSPPVAAYYKLQDLGFTVEATYYEPGMQFCGEFTDGEDFTYEIPDTSEEVDDVIPHHINDAFGIAESMAEWEAENEDED